MSNTPDRSRRAPAWAALAAACAAALGLLVACGGGGGGDAPPPDSGGPPPIPAAGYTLGGVLSMADNLVVDSDSNDPLQEPRADNGDFDLAQDISANSQVVGYANLPGAGPDGPNWLAGDEIDAFKVRLQAGQTVELDFAADPDVNDLDLYVFDSAGNVVGESIGVSRFECITISAGGDYTVAVQAFDGASLYNLRLALAGTTRSCATTTTTTALPVPGELIVAGAPAMSRQAAQALVQRGGLSVKRGSLDAGRLALLGLPAQARARATALSALRPGDAARRRARASGAPPPAAEAAPARRSLRDRPGVGLALDTVAYVKRLRASGGFGAVTFNRVLSTQALVGTLPSNDPQYGLQRWHYEQISLPAALSRLAGLGTQPTLRPVVAVVDTGVVGNHADLRDQLVAGYDFVRNASSAGDGDGIDGDPDDAAPQANQPVFHGSHVAGTVGAATFNAEGGAGVAPMALLMPVRVLGADGSGDFYDILQGVRFASGQGNDSGGVPARRADVINLSLGAAGVACASDDAAMLAPALQRGSILVAATGNEAQRRSGVTAPVGFPANCAGVIAVSATDAQREVAPYSCTGPQVAVAAPGGDQTRSTSGTGQSDGVYSTLATFDANGQRRPAYGALQGTSMATPHVAGVFALMRWVHPDITPEQVATLLAQGQLTDALGSAGRNAEFGYGLINARKAVEAALQLRGGATPPPAGVLELQPAVLSFGRTASELDFVIRTTAATSETVVSVQASGAQLSVQPRSVDAAGLGSYRVSVARAGLPVGQSLLTITVQTSLRTLQLAVSVDKAAATAPRQADAGPIYVLVVDVATEEVVDTVLVQASGGQYTWQASGIKLREISLVAGSDLDNDGFICNLGESCGGYPLLDSQFKPVTLVGDRSDLNFVIAPLAAGNASGQSLRAGGGGAGGWAVQRRR